MVTVTNPTVKSCAHTVGKVSQGIHLQVSLGQKHKRQCIQDHSVDDGNYDPDHGIIDVPIEDDDQADEEADDIDQDTDIEKIMKFIALFILKRRKLIL